MEQEFTEFSNSDKSLKNDWAQEVAGWQVRALLL